MPSFLFQRSASLGCATSRIFSVLHRLKRTSPLFFFLVSCVQYTHYTPDPERDIESWLKTFEQQRSFRYQYSVQTKSVYSEAQGNCVVGRGEHVTGVWYYADTKLDFEYVGLGDIEYTKQEGTWKQTPRGEESDILAQVKRLLKFDKFEYMGFLDGYVYQFKANIPFLAPDKWRELTGFLRISSQNFLPELIWAGLPDSSVYWQARLFNYNKVKYIEPPIRNWNTYLVDVDSAFGLRAAIKQRLDLADIDYRTQKTDEGIMLTLPSEYSTEDIEAFLAPGVVNVYSLAKNKSDATKVGYLMDDVKRPLFLKTKLFDQNDIKNVAVKFDALSRPFIHISLYKKFHLPAEIVFEIDNVLVGIATLDISKKIDKIRLYLDMGYNELNILKACIAQPLPAMSVQQTMIESP